MDNIKLISQTMPVEEMSHLINSDNLISYCARVSNPENQENFKTAEKLLIYCMSKSHWSIFEMVDLTFEITTTRDISRQILRHGKGFSFQEFSSRYAEITSDLNYKECRIQDEKNKQNSLSVPNTSILTEWWNLTQEEVWNTCKKMYNESLDKKIAKEQARSLLPEGLVSTKLYMKGSLRSWIHYCLVRCHPGTQKEHREIAISIWEKLRKEFSWLSKINIEKLAIKYQENFEKELKEMLNS